VGTNGFQELRSLNDVLNVANGYEGIDMSDVISEEEYWKRRRHVESQEGGGKFFCWHVWVTEVKGEIISVKYVRDFGETIRRSGIPSLQKCIKCGKRETQGGGLRGLEGSTTPI